MLFEPDRHEPLVAEPWNADRAAAAVEHIVARSHAAYARNRHFPSDPNDVGPLAPAPSPGVYFGGAGIIWGLAALDAHLPDSENALEACVRDTIANVETSEPDYRRGLLLGLAGPYAVASLLAANRGQARSHENRGQARSHDAKLADALHALVRDNATNPACEFMWGAPGTMLAAVAMHSATGEDRWRSAFLDSADELERRLTTTPNGVRLWQQDLYGLKTVYLGAVHGFASVLAPIVAGRALLGNAAFTRWRALATETTCATAVVEQHLANWPPDLLDGRPATTKRLVQLCHGAPGIIVALGPLADGTDPEFDALLAAGGELVWQAGPLAKGAGLCHGTAGNGYAFLRLFHQTQDERWLDRARAFAMHAIRQSDAAEQAHGDIRHSLWTGDIGVALYLRACETLDPRYPTLNYI